MPWPTYKTADEVPEPFRSEYEERDGQWMAKVPEMEKGPTRKEIERKAAADAKRAREAEERATALEQELAAKVAGVSPEELQKIRASVEAQYAAQLSELQGKNHELTFGAQMNELLANEVVDLQGARRLFDDRFEMSEAGTLVPKHDKSIPAKQFVESTLRVEKPYVFRGTQAAGGGAMGSKGAPASGKMSFEEFQKLDPVEKQKYAQRVEQTA